MIHPLAYGSQQLHNHLLYPARISKFRGNKSTTIYRECLSEPCRQIAFDERVKTNLHSLLEGVSGILPRVLGQECSGTAMRASERV
jgi:hypothetical protein